jgi:hypothetical protein
MIERPRKTHDNTRIARGNPSGLMDRRVGSTSDTGIDILTEEEKNECSGGYFEIRTQSAMTVGSPLSL